MARGERPTESRSSLQLAEPDLISAEKIIARIAGAADATYQAFSLNLLTTARQWLDDPKADVGSIPALNMILESGGGPPGLESFDWSVYEDGFAEALALLYHAQALKRQGVVEAVAIESELRGVINEQLQGLRDRVGQEAHYSNTQAALIALEELVEPYLSNLDEAVRGGKLLFPHSVPEHPQFGQMTLQQRHREFLGSTELGFQAAQRMGAQLVHELVLAGGESQTELMYNTLVQHGLLQPAARAYRDRLTRKHLVTAFRNAACGVEGQLIGAAGIELPGLPNAMHLDYQINRQLRGGINVNPENQMLMHTLLGRRCAGNAHHEHLLLNPPEAEYITPVASYQHALRRMKRHLEHPASVLGNQATADLALAAKYATAVIEVSYPATPAGLLNMVRASPLHDDHDTTAPRNTVVRIMTSPATHISPSTLAIAVEEHGELGGRPTLLRLWVPIYPANTQGKHAERYAERADLLQQICNSDGSNQILTKLLQETHPTHSWRRDVAEAATSAEAGPSIADISKYPPTISIYNPASAMKGADKQQKRQFAKIDACTHANMAWQLNATPRKIPDAMQMCCSDCGETHLAVVPLHRLPAHHKWAKLAQRPEYLALQRMHDIVAGAQLADSLAALRERDGEIDPSVSVWRASLLPRVPRPRRLRA